MTGAGESDVQAVLTELAERAWALVCARATVIEIERDGELVIAAGMGDLPPGLIGARLPASDTVASVAMRTQSVQRLDDPLNGARLRRHGVGRFGVCADSGLAVPLLCGGKAHGALVVLDPEAGPEYEPLLEAVALGAAAAAAAAAAGAGGAGGPAGPAGAAAEDRQRVRIAAAEAERRRWARNLHDETLQGLAAIRFQLAAARRQDRVGDGCGDVGGGDVGVGPGLGDAVDQTLEQLQAEIDSLRGLIANLRPAVLDELGLERALRALAERASRNGSKVDVVVDPACRQAARATDRRAELELAIYRITQEALTNAVKHGGPGQVTVELKQGRAWLHLSVSDDGPGFDRGPSVSDHGFVFERGLSRNGFGLIGMREHAELLGGTIRISSRRGEGTTVHAILPSFGAGEIAEAERVAPPVADSLRSASHG